MIVMKFGGTSVKDPAAIRRLTRFVDRAHRAGGPLVVVVSALAGVTDQLLTAAESAGAGERSAVKGAAGDVAARHIDMLQALVSDAARLQDLTGEVQNLCDDLKDVLLALCVLRDVSPRSIDAVASCGELLSSQVAAAALAEAGLPAVWLDPRQLIVTDAEFTSANPVMADTRARLQTIAQPEIAHGRVVVTGGFVGATRDGVTTTLGRGGSDYSAAIIGAGLDADEIQIWTDVDGMLTADPRIVPRARLVPHLSYSEAAELAYFGAKVLHPGTIKPAVAQNIPVRILNSMREPDPAADTDSANGAGDPGRTQANRRDERQARGTLITTALPTRRDPITALACKRGITVINVSLGRMAVEYGWLRRLFEVFERHRTAVDVVTTSEASVSVTIEDRGQLTEILESLSSFAEASAEEDLALLCVVGEHVLTDATLAARVLGTLEGVGLRMVSQAASRRNITMVLREDDLPDAMTRLHGAFFEDASQDRDEDARLMAGDAAR